MKNKDIINKNSADLNRLIAEKREVIRLFNFGGAGAKAKNVKLGRETRKDIARILTALNASKK